MVALTPLRKSQIVNYFDQIRDVIKLICLNLKYRQEIGSGCLTEITLSR
jgi:hypothetical protein